MSTLFPILPRDPAPLAPPGIARLAAEAERLEEKSQIEYLGLECRSILNRCDSPRMPFQWTINPYRGCEFGCHYCYARYTHEYMELCGAEFEQKIYAKQDAAAILRSELRRGAGQGVIAMGTATDPYQPAERRFRVTRDLLEVFATEPPGLQLSITTKSDLVVRDLELLKAIAARHTLSVNLTVTTMKRRLARLLEPRAPRPDLRMAAVRRLAEAGLTVGVFAAPVLPGITDDAENLDTLFQAAKLNQAQYVMISPLFLTATAREQFYPFLKKHFPRLMAGYRRRFSAGAYQQPGQTADLKAVVARLREKYGLPAGPMQHRVEVQGRLFG
jgi:DNA repair photolyase